MSLSRKFLLIAFAVLTLALSKPGLAIDYDVEVIIFEHARNTGVGSSSTYLYPVVETRVRYRAPLRSLTLRCNHYLSCAWLTMQKR